MSIPLAHALAGLVVREAVVVVIGRAKFFSPHRSGWGLAVKPRLLQLCLTTR